MKSEQLSLFKQVGKTLHREDLTQRNEYRQLANRYKAQWEEQKQVVAELTTLLETLQKKAEEAERKRDVIVAQSTNVEAHQHLQDTLTAVQDGAAFEIIDKMEQNATEAATLAKAAVEADSELTDMKVKR